MGILAALVAAQTTMRLEEERLKEERRKARLLERPKGLRFGNPLEPLRKDATRINRALFGR